MGANDIYDVVKFKTEFDKKAAALQPALQAATPGETVTCFPTQHRNLPTDRMERLPRLIR